MMRHYILDGKKPVPAPILEWSHWMETAERHVADLQDGSIRISTVFLGLDHQFNSDGPPLLFETMVFGGVLDGEQDRCSTWEEAEQMQHKMAERVLAAEASKRKED